MQSQWYLQRGSKDEYKNKAETILRKQYTDYEGIRKYHALVNFYSCLSPIDQL